MILSRLKTNYYARCYLLIFFPLPSPPQWYHSAYPETTDTIPIRIDKYFNVLMLIRCFRTDRVYQTVENYIYQMTGVNDETCTIVKKNIK